MIVFATKTYAYLGSSIATQNFRAGEVEEKRFSDGESYHRILTPVEGQDVAVIGGTCDDCGTLDLYDLSCGLVQQGARSLTMVIPYFGYSTMERGVKPGEIVKAKTRAHLLSSVPATSSGNRVVLIDLHTEGLPYYFSTALRPIHLYAKPVVMQAARDLGGNDFMLASTDAGRAKWVESLANDMKVDAAFVYKRRTSGSETKVTGVNASVAGRHVIIYDDMIRTGGSLIEAAKVYMNAGAAKISVIATHGIFPEGAIDKLRSSGMISQVVTTDTHPNALRYAGDFLKVYSVASLIQEVLTPR